MFNLRVKTRRGRMTPRVTLTLGLVLMLSSVLLWHRVYAGGGGGGQYSGNQGTQVLSVTVAKVSAQSVPLTISALGHVLPAHSVAVRPQVTGVITRVGFKDGADVRKGQLLFQLDPRPFQAAVDAAAATLKKDQAALAYAHWKVEHLAPQVQAGAASADTYRIAESDAAQLAAAVAADRANLEKARLDLTYTTIRAPLAARAGAATLNTGNLVQADAPTPLVTLNQLAPIDVAFTIPQNDLAAVQHFQQAAGPLVVWAQPLGAGNSLANAVAAGADTPSAGALKEPGTLDFIDNTVTADSGTVTLRARFANDDQALWPGAFVSVQLVLSVDQNALVVPSSAIQQGQSSPFVYVVVDGKALLRNVKVTREQGTLAVIGAGLKIGEQVVTQVPRNLRDGTPVKIGSSTAGNAPAAGSTGNGGKSGGSKNKGVHRHAAVSSAAASP